MQAKIQRQIAFIKTHNFTNDFDWRSRVEAMETLLEHLPEQMTVDSLRGIEGSASRHYFECFGAMLTRLSFGGRIRIYPLCADCGAKVTVLGYRPPIVTESGYVVV